MLDDNTTTILSAHNSIDSIDKAGPVTSMVESVIDKLAWLGSKQPGANPNVYGVDVVRDVRYATGHGDDHLLDVYTPTDIPGPWPVVLYVHGGGFRLLSKDTHWMMAIAFARRGYAVFNMNYRLAPEHPFPAALQDVSAAYLWMLDNAAAYGGDSTRRVVAGESAGANLVTALTLAATSRQPEPWAREVFDANAVPHALIAKCGILQMSQSGRLVRGRPLLGLVNDWLDLMESGYIGGQGAQATRLANPLLMLEEDGETERPLPPVFTSVGGDDPLLDDNQRLAAALRHRGVAHHMKVYAGEGHAFQMMTWRSAAKESWADTFGFLDQHLPKPAGTVRLAARRRSLAQRARYAIIDALAA